MHLKIMHSNVINSIVTGAVIDPNTTTQLLSCTESDKTTYENFIDERFLRKSKNYLTLFLKRRQNERNTASVKPLHIQKTELEALKYIDYARLKMYDIRQLLKHVFAPLTLYLTKEKLRKPEKHHLTNAIAARLQVLPLKYVPINDKKRDFA